VDALLIALIAMGCCVVHATIKGRDPGLAESFAGLAFTAGAVLVLTFAVNGDWRGVPLNAAFCAYCAWIWWRNRKDRHRRKATAAIGEKSRAILARLAAKARPVPQGASS
jgi:hypothetical protein